MSRPTAGGVRRSVIAGITLALAAFMFVFVNVPDQMAMAQGAPSMTIASPGANATVTSPVTVRVETQNANIKPADQGDRGSQHLHFFVDIDPSSVLQTGQPIPTGRENIVHTADTSQTLTLPAGQHTVWVVMSNVDHIPLTPGVQAQVTVPVGAPASGGAQATPTASPSSGGSTPPPATGLPSTGTSGAIADSTSGRVGFLVVMLAVGVSASVLLRRRTSRVS
jgi:hypothetical protein